MADPTLFSQRRLARSDPVKLACGRMPLALAGALCGPAALRTVNPVGSGARARLELVFEHSTVGRLSIAVPTDDALAHDAVRELRGDPGGFARLFALLACAIELDGKRGRFTYESVHRLTHGPAKPGVNRVRLNAPIEALLHLLSVAPISWRPPTARGASQAPAGKTKRPKRTPADPTIDIGPLLQVDVLNRKARTVSISAAGRDLLQEFSLDVAPTAFVIARPAKGRTRPATPIMARLRLAGLIAARWRGARRGTTPQRVSFGDLLTRFAWVALDAGDLAEPPTGASEAAGRSLRPRLREAAAALAADLGDARRYGGGLRAPLELAVRAPMRCMFALGLPQHPVDDAAPQDSADVPATQPTLEEGRLRDATAPPIFTSSRPEEPVSDSCPHGQDDWRAGGQHRRPAEQFRGTVAVAVTALGDGRVILEFANGFGVVLPADIADAADLRGSLPQNPGERPSKHLDWRVGGQDARQDARPDSLGSPADSLASSPETRVGGQYGTPKTPVNTRVSGSDHSDDLDRARGSRLPAALAPPPATLPPAAPPQRRPRGRPPSSSDDPDHRRTA